MVRAIMLILSLLSLYSCITPAGQIKPEDVNLQESTVQGNVIDIYKRIYQGFRTCESGWYH
jgi:hypothetical protein